MRLTGLWWWIDRWRTSSTFVDLTLEAQGAYRNLLDEALLRGGWIPNDDHVLAIACGDARRWPRLRSVVLARFTLEPDGWHPNGLDQLFRARSYFVPSDPVRRPDIPAPLQRLVLARDRVCVWCGAEDRLEIDHITRWRDGGDHSEQNLRVLCQACNRGRG